MSARGEKSYAYLKGVSRASAILFAVAEKPLRATELAKQLDLKWTTLYRTLIQLEQEGMVFKDPATSAYRIGPSMFVVGTSYLVHHPLIRSAPLLRLLADEIGAAAQINERIGFEVVNLLALEARSAIRALSVGFRFPLHVTSKGQLLLAHAPPEIQDEFLSKPLKRFTKETVTDPGHLRERLDLILRDGYAETRADLQPRVGSVAAPIHGPDAEVVACVTAVLEESRMRDTELHDRLVDTVIRTGTRISDMAGWPLQPEPAPQSEP